MEKNKIYEKLLLGIINADDVGSKKLVSLFARDRETHNGINYACMIYKLYCLTSHTGNKPREGTVAIMAKACSHAIADMFGKNPEYWEKRILLEVESYRDALNTGEETPISKITETVSDFVSGTLTINFSAVHEGPGAIEQIDEFMNQLIKEFYMNMMKAEKSSAKAASGSGCLISVLGMLVILAVCCVM